jgi:hypothetical protein
MPEDKMFARVTPDGRLLAFNFGDWALLVAGLALATAVVALFA